MSTSYLQNQFNSASPRGRGSVTELFVNDPIASRKMVIDTFIRAARAGNLASVAGFLDKDPSIINEKDEWGKTALMHAAASGHKDIVELLLEKDAPIDKQDNHGRTALNHAQTQNQTEIIAVLEEWPEKKWLRDTDCHRGLEEPMPVPHLINPRRGRGAPP